MRRGWIIFSIGGVGCLLGCAFYFLSRRLSSKQSSGSSEDIQEALRELKLFRQDTEMHLENLFERVRSVAGRIDRAKRKAPPEEEPPAEAAPGASPEDIEQSRLNALVARRILGAG